MRDHDPTAPLIFIHVPKTAGTSVRAIVKDWFPDQFHPHYLNDATGQMPERPPEERMTNSALPPVIYGHLDRDRGTGIEQFYPEVRQFLAILRNPFDTTVSAIYFWRKFTDPQADLGGIGSAQIEKRLRKRAPNTLRHFPHGITMENFRDVIEERFIHIGVTEDLPRSMVQIAARLGKPFVPGTLPRANVTDRQRDFPQSLRDDYRARFPLEHAIYDFARDLVARG